MVPAFGQCSEDPPCFAQPSRNFWLAFGTAVQEPTQIYCLSYVFDRLQRRVPYHTVVVYFQHNGLLSIQIKAVLFAHVDGKVQEKLNFHGACAHEHGVVRVQDIVAYNVLWLHKAHVQLVVQLVDVEKHHCLNNDEQVWGQRASLGYSCSLLPDTGIVCRVFEKETAGLTARGTQGVQGRG